MNKITSFSVNYPISVLMIILAIILLGSISYDKLSIDLFPDLNNPRLFIDFDAGEMPPDEIENQFVESIESVAMRQQNVTEISSSIKVGNAHITVEYDWDADMDESLLDLQKSLSNFAQNSTLENLQVSQQDFNNKPVIQLAFFHPDNDDLDNLRKIAINYLRNELIRLPGIAAVEISGAEENELVIEVNPWLLKGYGLDMDGISAKIRSLNRSLSAGSITEMGKKYIITSQSDFKSIEDFQNIIVATPRGSGGNTAEGATAPVMLKDVAKIYFQSKDPENIVRFNQRRCLGLGIYKESRYNTVKAVDDVEAAMLNLRKALPGYQLVEIDNQADFINQAIGEVEDSALLGIFLAVIILFVFLRRWGTTLIISIAIPISIIATFNLMYFNGLTLNIMTLGGLALGAGMLVDNAIVVMENIFRHLEEGMPIKEASIKGASEVSGAITASTITTIIVFLPIVYVQGAAGELFKEQAWTVAFSLLSSLVVAILFIPMLSSRLLKKQDADKGTKSIRFVAYKNVLQKILDRRLLVIGGSILLLIFTWFSLNFVGSDFMPRSSGDKFEIDLSLEEGSTLELTDQFSQGVNRYIRQYLGEDLKEIYFLAGSSTEALASTTGNELEGDNSAKIEVYLKKGAIDKAQDYINGIRKMLDGYPDLHYNIVMDQSTLQATLGINEAPVDVEISGEDIGKLNEITKQFSAQMRDMDFLENVESSLNIGQPQVNIVVDRLKAGIYNLDVNTISSQIEALLSGVASGQWDVDGEQRDILVKSPSLDLQQLKNTKLQIGNQEVSLDEVADVRLDNAENEIIRRNQTRLSKISAQIKGDIPLDQVVERIKSQLDGIKLPDGYKYTLSGEEQKRAESFGSLKFALILSIILIYMVLAAQFESLIHPLTILLTIPLAAVGAILIFLFLGKSLNIMAYIGIIMLVGIAVNDSIILVDAINQLRAGGMNILDAIFAAGQRRIRPIIMTSITTILALLPLTISFGESVSLRAPMALAVIGGLITSTILTLVVIPCVYYYLDKLRFGDR